LSARNPNTTLNAINQNKGGMGYLSSTITADSANKISVYLNSLTISSAVNNTDNEQGESHNDNDSHDNEQGESHNENDSHDNEQGESHNENENENEQHDND